MVIDLGKFLDAFNEVKIRSLNQLCTDIFIEKNKISNDNDALPNGFHL